MHQESMHFLPPTRDSHDTVTNAGRQSKPRIAAQLSSVAILESIGLATLIDTWLASQTWERRQTSKQSPASSSVTSPIELVTPTKSTAIDEHDGWTRCSSWSSWICRRGWSTKCWTPVREQAVRSLLPVQEWLLFKSEMHIRPLLPAKWDVLQSEARQ